MSTPRGEALELLEQMAKALENAPVAVANATVDGLALGWLARRSQRGAVVPPACVELAASVHSWLVRELDGKRN